MRKLFGRIVLFFVILAALLIFSLSAQAQSETTVVPFKANVQGEVTIPTTVVSPAPAAAKPTVIRVPDTRQISELSRENGRLQFRIEQLEEELNGQNAQAASATTARRNDDWIVFALVALIIGVIVGMLLRFRPTTTTNNHYHGRRDQNDPAPDGLNFSLGRKLEEGDEIIIRRSRAVPAVTERITTQRFDVSESTTALVKDVMAMLANRSKQDRPDPESDGKRPAPKPDATEVPVTS